jgi:class 3 adenylate cyclase
VLIERVMRRGGTVDDIAQRPDDLEGLASSLQLRPTSRIYSLRQVAQHAGLDLDKALQINRTAGFPDPDPDAPLFDDEDVEVFRVFKAASEVFGEERALQISRVMGWAMSRVAEAMISIFASNLGEESQTRELDEQAFAAANALAVAMIPGAVHVMNVTLRRHMEARSRTDGEIALGEEWQGVDALDRAIGFCDLVGYTELSEQLTTTAMAELLERFEGRAADIVVARGGTVVKLIGDEVMFVAGDVDAARAIALDLVDAFGSDALPPVRVGIAAGQVVLREADYFGSVVNLAARIVKLAAPGRVLAPATMRDDASPGAAFAAAGEHVLKGFDEPVELVEICRR